MAATNYEVRIRTSRTWVITAAKPFVRTIGMFSPDAAEWLAARIVRLVRIEVIT